MGTKHKPDGKQAREDRIIDLIERFAAAHLYASTPLGQTDVAKALGIGNDRANEILKGIKKRKQNAKEEKRQA